MLRRALGVLVCVGVATMASMGGVAAQDEPQPEPTEEEVAQTRQGLVAQRQAAVNEVAELDRQIVATDERIVEESASLESQQNQRTALLSRRERAQADREQPLAIRRAIAIESYMAGDPYSMSLIREVLDASSSMDGIRDRAMFTSIVEWAAETLDELDAEIEQLTGGIAEIDARIPEIEAELAQLQAALADHHARRSTVVARIADLERRIAALSRAPLTGLSVASPSARPILIVKIDNISRARPQAGLNQADIVIEERVEGGLSRFAALFQSSGSDPVGPVRSARTSDVVLFANLDSPLFAYSGSNRGVLGALQASNLIDVGATTTAEHYYRDSRRSPPSNLFTRTSALWAQRPGGLPSPIFQYRAEGAGLPAGARPVTGVDVSYGATTAGFTWNGSGWVRTTDGRSHTDAAGAAIAPANVVVRFTDYVPSPADGNSPEAVVTGSGTLWVLTAGHVVEGRWEQASLRSPTRWLDAAGNPIALTPGRTWIVMPDPGRGSLR